jgi:methionine-rich copper-binding protein CopC
MRIKLALVSAITAIACLALVQPASAAYSYIKVVTTPDIVNLCRAAPEQVRFNFEFSSKITRTNSPKPKRVLVTYSVVDTATGALVSSGRVTLTPKNKFRKQSLAITAAAGQALTYKLKQVYRAPRSGKLVKSTASIDDQIPTAAQLDSLATPLPACV